MQSPLQTVAMDTLVQIPGYHIERQIGSGAMATVYLAIQKSLERRVALKVMAASLAADPSFCERFLKEGKIVGQLTHPHIVTIYDIGVFHSCYYMAMEYVGSGTLKHRLEQGLSMDQAVDILCQIAEALGYAHQRGFIHRDVKPANILFRDNDAAVLSDFGIAKALGGSTQITAAGWTVGTPNYMSPEQALGRSVDARSDLYSLGIVFYEMLTGVKPYQSEDPFATALMHVNNPLPQLPAPFACYQGILNRLLAKDPNERFASAEDLLKAIHGVRSPLPNLAEQTRLIAPAGKGRRPGHSIGWVGLGFALPLIGAGIYFLMVHQPPEPTPSPDDEIITPSPPPPPHIQEQIDQLLRVAAAHYEVERWTEPPGSNAADTYRRVLELDPQNVQARAGLKAIADQYEAMAHERLENNDLEAALELAETGLSVVSHRGLLSLHEQIKKATETQ